MRDFRRKDKKKTKASSSRFLRFSVIARLTGSDKTHILLYERAATMPRPSSQAKSPSDDGLFACEIVYTRRERRGYIKWGLSDRSITNPDHPRNAISCFQASIASFMEAMAFSACVC